jgi:hypothetical protein
VTSVSPIAVPVLVESVEGQHAVSCARPAEACHRLTVRMRRNAREDVVDGPGAILFDAATLRPSLLWQSVKATECPPDIQWADRTGLFEVDSDYARESSACDGGHPSRAF